MEYTGFKTRARVVDLLGREQIADAPTAITELLKNAVDAQANNVAVHYHSKQRLLELSDDGLGMRPDDLTDRWLVLATDSRHGAPDKNWLKYASTEQRKRAETEKPFGEKGIGRLAIAALGNAVIVWTKWGKGKDQKRSMALVHWHLFRFSKVNLDEVFVPYVELSEDDDPAAFASLLIEDLVQWFNEKGKNLSVDSRNKKIFDDLNTDLSGALQKSVQSISNYSFFETGTSFFILSTTEEVDELFSDKDEQRKKRDDYLPNEGLRTFYGFCDPFQKDHTRLKINVQKDFKEAYAKTDEINFWTPDDFAKVDHFIDISVDEKGFVTGKIRKYDTVFEYNYNCPDLPPRQTFPGKFRILLGYLPGNKTDSTLKSNDWESFNDRLKAYGDLYIYRDGIRVMPYGRYDTDFLSFEERRSRNVGRYFFSHRRMVGAIYIDHKQNPNLIDKAGREGFLRNKYYRGLTELCINIFIDLADSYFGSKANAKEEKHDKKKSAYTDEIKIATAGFVDKFSNSRKHLESSYKRIEMEYTRLDKALNDIPKMSIAEIKKTELMYDEIRDNFLNDMEVLIDEIPSLAKPSQNNLAVWDSYLTEKQQFAIN